MPVVQTSLDSFFTLKGLGAKQRRIYNLLQDRGPMSNGDISQALSIPVNEVCPRVYELRSLGKVKEAFKAPSKITGKRVLYWVVKE